MGGDDYRQHLRSVDFFEVFLSHAKFASASDRKVVALLGGGVRGAHALPYSSQSIRADATALSMIVPAIVVRNAAGIPNACP